MSTTSIQGGFGFTDILNIAGKAAGGAIGAFTGGDKDKKTAALPSPQQMAYVQQQAVAKAMDDERRRKEEEEASQTRTLMFVMLGAIGLGGAYLIFKNK